MALPIKVFTQEELKAYFKGGARGHFYEKTVDMYKQFLPHSDGGSPMHIIGKQRPNEPDVVKAFRISIWEPITKPTFDRVISSLSKIRRSSDWSIIYPTDTADKIADGEKLQDYCESNFPYFTSITNWVFGVVLKQYLIDPNAVALVMPLYLDVDETKYLEPFPFIYNSCDVIKYKEQEYAILRIAEGCMYFSETDKLQVGQSYYVVTSMVIQRYDQADEKGNFRITFEYPHNLGFLPVFKLGGVICDSTQNDFLYESRISGMLPNLNEAIAEYTDLQAGKRLNIYPERWEFTQHECPKCKGTGLLPNPGWKDGDAIDLRQVQCRSCENGYIPSGPYSKMLVRPSDAGQQQIPTPPAGYILKDIEIIRLMDQSVDKHIYKALSAINFQFLDQTPLNQSGVAKEVDKEELNNTVHSIAEDIVAFMDKVYKTIAHYRYMLLYSQEELKVMLPKIAVPEHFDLISSQYMQEEIKRAREAKINTLLVSQMEVEYSGKRFAQDDIMNTVIRLVHKLDPLPGKTTEEKLVMQSSKTITRENHIISDNLVYYLRRALYENPDFEEWELKDQEELLMQYAKEQITKMDEAAKLIAQALLGEGGDTQEDEDALPPNDEEEPANTEE